MNIFDKFKKIGIEGDTKNHEDCQMYSKNSLKWTDNSGEENISYLTVQGEMYKLNTYHVKTKQVKVRRLLIESNGDISDKDRENARKKYIKMYVTENELPIQYYKESGWDLVDIFAE